MPQSWCYMLRCADGSFYVGCTTNLDQRIGQHQGGETPGYTSTRRPVECVWAEEFQSIHDAIDAERRIKGWSRAKKQALIEATGLRSRAWPHGRDADRALRASRRGYTAPQHDMG